MQPIFTDGVRIRVFRKDTGWTQEDLSKKAFLSTRHIRTLEHGANTTLSTIHALAKAFDCNPNHLIKQT